MNIFLYIIIFIIGTLFGSFYTLAVYRIPKKIDIVKTHSFCPNCNHKLGFFELIPVWSYLFLGGKCKNCKQKIRPRYFILETLSGITFVLLALALKINVETLNIKILVEVAFIVLYLVAIFLIAGIDKENKTIQKGVIYYALGILIMYIIYLCIMGTTSIYRYVMYLSVLLILLIVDTIILQKKAKNSYTISILMLLLIMTVFTGEFVTICTIICTLLAIAFTIIYHKAKSALNKTKKEHTEIYKNLPIGFFLCLTNVLSLIVVLFINNWNC